MRRQFARIKVIDIDQLHDFLIIVTQRLSFFRCEQPDGQCFFNLMRQIQCSNATGLDAFHPDATLQRFGSVT